MNTEGYTKLSASILTSTIWMESDQTRIVWLTMMALCDRHGFVSGTLPGLANVARVSIEDCQKAISAFLAKDKYSRTKEHGGRRIKEVDGGWFLLNFHKYRDARDADDRRDYMRQYVADYRLAGRDKSRPVNNGKLGKPGLAQAEAEAKASTKLNKGDKASEKPRLTQKQREVAGRFSVALNSQWANDRGKWFGRIREDCDKCQRVIAEVESAIKEGRIQTSPAQFAEDTWKRFEVQP